MAASFATNTDLVLAESGARMGFAGPRVIRQVTGRALPDGFQTAEFLLRHGQVDMVVPRRALRGRLAALLAADRPAGRRGAHRRQPGGTGAGRRRAPSAGPAAPRPEPRRPDGRRRPWDDRYATVGRLRTARTRPTDHAGLPGHRASTASSSCTATGSARTARRSSAAWPGSTAGR